METNVSGKIHFFRIPASRALRRFAEKQIKNWIRSNFDAVRTITAFYQIEFRREGSGHTFNCQIEIHLGNQTWIGHNYQGGLHQALIQCLSSQMIPAPA